MADRKDFESFGENRIPETFSFSEKENQKQLLSDDFVFKMEDNTKQEGYDVNKFDLGEEDNKVKPAKDDNFDDIKEAASETNASESTSEATTSTPSSPAASSSSGAASSSSGAAIGSSVSSTVATVAATTTAAVVLVVGGGIALGQTLERPQICEFNEISLVERSISFTLSVGNDQAKIDAGEEDTECDIRVELRCPTNEDFLKEVPTTHFGKVSGEFADLEYDTEYLLDVRQHVMLSADAESLLDKPISLRTATNPVQPEPEPEELINSISIYKIVNPMGGETYSAEVNYQTAIPTYSSYCIALAETSLVKPADNTSGTETTSGEETTSGDGGGEIVPDEGGDEPGDKPIDWSYRSATFDAAPSGRIEINAQGEQLTASSYTAALIGIDENENQTVLFSTELAPSSFGVVQDKTNEKLYINRIISNDISYHAYFALTDVEEVYNITCYLADHNDAAHTPLTRFVLEKANDEEFITLDFGEYANYGEYDAYDFFIDYGKGEEVVQYIDLSTIPTLYVEPGTLTNSISITRNVNPMGGETYSAEIDYQVSVPSFSTYFIGLADTQMVKPDGQSIEEQIDWIFKSDMFSEAPTGKVAINAGGDQLSEGSYTAALVGVNDQEEETVLFSSDVNYSSFIVNDTFENETLYINRVIENVTYNTSYHAYFYLSEGGDVSNITCYLADPNDQTQSVITRFGLEIANDEEEITLDFTEFPDYGDRDAYNFVIDYGKEDSIVQYIDLNNIPTVYVDPDPTTFTVYKEVDPMNGSYYYVDLDYNGELPSYTYYGVYLRGKNSQDEQGTGEWIESPYDFSITGKQPLYTGGVLESPYYEIALVGYEESDNFTIISSDTVKPEDFVSINPDLTYNRVFFQNGFDKTAEEEHTFIYLNVPGGEDFSRVSVTIKDPKDEQTSVNIQDPELNTKWEISSFEQLGLDPSGVYKVTVEAVTSATTGISETIIDETIDFGLIPYYIYDNPTFFGAAFSIARGGNNYTTAFIEMQYEDCGYWSDFQIDFYINGDYDNPYASGDIKSFDFNGVERFYIDDFNVETSGQDGLDYIITAESTDPMNSGRIKVFQNGSFDLYLASSEDITDKLDGIVNCDIVEREDEQTQDIISYMTVNITFNDEDLPESITSIDVSFENVSDASDSFNVNTTDNIGAQVYIDPGILLDDVAGKTYYVTTYAYINGVRTSLYTQRVSFSV